MSGISCDCSYGDYDQPDVYRSRIMRAKKPHRCCECHEDISPGEAYELVDGLWDGEWSHFSTCLTCVRIRSDYCGGGFLHGGLVEALWECLGVKL